MAALAFNGFWPVVTDADHMLRAAEIAEKSAGLSAPHPNCGCVIARGPKVISEGFLRAKGAKSAELQAVEMAGEHARGATAYLNLEPATGEAVRALAEAGLARVVVGLRNPAKDASIKAIEALHAAGMAVDALGETASRGEIEERVLRACREVNVPLLYRSACGVPFSVLKYAMTLDGKIAATGGHAAWVSGEAARRRVLELRRRSDAVIVGGATVRHDDPLLTTREPGGHVPLRIVMSASLDLPEDARLWDVAEAPTVVVTARGARRDVQRRLAAKGVEVVEFDPPTTRAAMEYFARERGFLSVVWECGGNLAAPAIAGGVVHKVMAFVAPKIVGGDGAPCPVGELGIFKMTDALNLTDVTFEQVGDDMLVTGYLHPIPSGD